MYVLNGLSQCFLLYLTFCIMINTATCSSLSTYYMERPGRNLCVNTSEDCSNQVKSTGDSNASCFMTFLRANSTECSDSQFKGDEDAGEELGIVSLNPFPWYTEGIRQPNLNITFSKIRWKSLRMRYVHVGSDKVQLCRGFEVSEDIDPSSVISFDCSWVLNLPGTQYKFQYVLVSKDNRKLSRTYLLQIPADSDVASDVKIEDFHVFTIMDPTSYPVLSALIRVPPRRLNISNVIVTFHHKEHSGGSSKLLKYVSVNVTNVREGEFITVSAYNTDNVPGVYYFTTDCKSGDSGRSCGESSTPPLEIEPKMSLQVKLAMAFIALATIGVLGVLILRRTRQNVHCGHRKQNVLFVYESSFPSLIDNIYKFREFLDLNCPINSKLDLIEIPKSEAKNPWIWYRNAFEEADYVLLFASPKEGTEKGVHEDNVYRDLQTYALALMINYLSNKHKFKVASVRLPGCSWKTLPLEVDRLIRKRFSLPESFDRLCEFMNVPTVPDGASAFVTALQQTRRRPQITLPKTTPPPELSPFYSSDNETTELVLPSWIHINIDGKSSSEEDEEPAVSLDNLVL